MSLYLEQKYLSLVSSRLQRFKQTGRETWNFRCPICGDSEKSQSKARGYVYVRDGGMFYRCHNCNYGTTFSKFLEHIDQFLYKEYLFETLQSSGKYHKKNEVDFEFSQPTFTTKTTIDLDSIDQLHNQHYALTYLKDRGIPIQHYKNLYYAPDYKKFAETINPEKAARLKPNDPRIVIPFFTSSGTLFAVQGRALVDPKVRYITVKVPEYQDSLLVFGMNRVNIRSKVYIVEGPFDSFFLDNCVAVAGSELLRVEKLFEDKVFVFDNQPYNKDVCKSMAYAFSRGHKVVVWPRDMREKDLNDMFLSGKHIQTLVDKNTQSGLEGQAIFAKWRKA